MRTNSIVTKMNADQIAYGCALTFPSTTVTELIGLAGFDFVMFDGEHGPFNIETLEDLCRTADMSGLTPVARVPNIEPSTILRFLDRGIMGIMGPHITTGEKAQQLADACRYAPRGKRSFGSVRGAYYGELASYEQHMEHTNSQILVMAQLEDFDVLDNLDDIVAVDGIDLFGSGPQDIAQSMGLPGQPDHPRVTGFQAIVRDAVHAAGKMMSDDALVVGRVNKIFLDAAKAYLGAESEKHG